MAELLGGEPAGWWSRRKGGGELATEDVHAEKLNKKHGKVEGRASRSRQVGYWTM